MGNPTVLFVQAVPAATVTPISAVPAPAPAVVPVQPRAVPSPQVSAVEMAAAEAETIRRLQAEVDMLRARLSA